MMDLVEELRGVRDRLYNSERFIVFHKVILQQSHHVTASHAIWQIIEKRLDNWEEDRHGILVQETLHTCKKYLSAAHREEFEEHKANTYHSLVLRGELQTEVRGITERRQGACYRRRS